jgi:transcriptional regulator with XRE-family HTH domain
VSKLPGPELPDLQDHLHDLGAFLREQRQNAKLSLRQLSELAGVSNPYLSQIERGLKKPSAEILQQLARGLEVSAETLYVRAGILDERPVAAYEGPSVLEAIAKDPALTNRQRAVLVDIYESFVRPNATADPAPTTATTSKEK